MNRVVAIVPTYNRLELLKENIQALLCQSYSGLDVMIINNASTDSTADYVKSLADSRIVYYDTGANLGGAGGFAYGMRKALEAGYDYAWLMDDDSIVMKDALEVLMQKAMLLDRRFSFMATTVYWTDGTQFPMNTCGPEKGFQLNIDKVFEERLIPISKCSFVGCFINLAYAEKVGLPFAEYFIYGDDQEYTMRLRKEERAYWAIDSKIVHKAPTKIGSDIVRISSDRIDRFSIQTRNGLHICRCYGGTGNQIVQLLKRIRHIILRSPDYKLRRIKAIVVGMMQGITFNPKIVYINRPANNRTDEMGDKRG